ncbi:MAG: TrkH family potassium uptake protein [Pirellulales bacterium]
MNYRLVSKLLSIVCLLIGVTMVFSLPWAFPSIGHRTAVQSTYPLLFEYQGFFALLCSIAISLIVAALFWYFGKDSKGDIFRKEAMAVVGLSWVVATVLGAAPFMLSGTARGVAVRLFNGPEYAPQVYGKNVDKLDTEHHAVISALVDANAAGLSEEDLIKYSQRENAVTLFKDLHTKEDWNKALVSPNQEPAPADRVHNYRIRAIPMNVADALFESQSGFSTTGATVIADLEDPISVPHCILFWRSSTHFLGGLGIIVLFVVILGQGSAGKALMQAEMPGPSKEGSHSRMQHTAWLFTATYCGLNLALTVILMALGMTMYDAICHAFGTMATGGFSTYNASLGHFYLADQQSGAIIEYVIILFMLLAGTNFTLLYFLILRQPGKMLGDTEWRAYMSIILCVTILIMGFGLVYHDFQPAGEEVGFANETGYALRNGLFQVVSVITTTGYGTHDFNAWNSFGRGILFLLMFIGGCAGSTGGGMKVIRHVLFHKILFLQLEKSYHPSVIRPLRLRGEPVDDPDLQRNILVYFGLILVLFVLSWMLVVTIEPDSTWGTSDDHIEHKLIDTATSIAATLNNIGPGLGIIGATQNYTHFTWWTKIVFTWLMMIGRLEIYVILVLFMPGFWRSRSR